MGRPRVKKFFPGGHEGQSGHAKKTDFSKSMWVPAQEVLSFSLEEEWLIVNKAWHEFKLLIRIFIL